MQVAQLAPTRVINIRDSEDITYTIENMACDDWTIADNCGAKGEI